MVFLLLTRLLPSSLKGTHWWNVGQLCTAYVHWVRLFSFPGSTPVCGLLFFTGRTCADNYPRSSWKKKPTHTGVDPGKLNERTHWQHLTPLMTSRLVCIAYKCCNWVLYFQQSYWDTKVPNSYATNCDVINTIIYSAIVHCKSIRVYMLVRLYVYFVLRYTCIGGKELFELIKPCFVLSGSFPRQ